MDRALEQARVRLGRFFGASPERVVFTLNATDALNIAIHGSVRPGDHVVTTAMEHNSVLRPLEALRHDAGVEHTIVPADSRGRIDIDAFAAAITTRTSLAVVTHASNVCGTLQPVVEIAAICRERGVRLLVDAAQTAGLRPLDLRALGADLLAVPGHKGLLGPPGTGALLLADGVDVRPLRHGGTGSESQRTAQPLELPQRLEAGSPNGPAIAALAAGVAWIESRGVEALGTRLARLGARFATGLERIARVDSFGCASIAEREPLFSLRVSGIAPDELAAILDASFGIETRAGLHCAPHAHRALGSWPEGSVRVAPGVFTTDQEIDSLLDALVEIGH